ncbi:hypothetical protein DFH29DRAFT_938200 [Suillus ampliporus]|nr:hypothetical protein DFH29DRAFT_938200 [Suillus ampliporus]
MTYTPVFYPKKGVIVGPAALPSTATRLKKVWLSLSKDLILRSGASIYSTESSRSFGHIAYTVSSQRIDRAPTSSVSDTNRVHVFSFGSPTCDYAHTGFPSKCLVRLSAVQTFTRAPHSGHSSRPNHQGTLALSGELELEYSSRLLPWRQGLASQ